MIIIVGGGIVGLTFANLMADAHFQVSVIESHPPTIDANSPTARASAIHLTSVKLLRHLNIWECLTSSSRAPLRRMLVWDHSGGQLQFDSENLGFPEMAWIVENRALIQMLQASLKLKKNVMLYYPRKGKKIFLEKEKIKLELDDGQVLTGDLIVGADGAHSWVRQHMPIHLTQRAYHQKAIIAVIQSEQPHHDTAYQKFLTTGPVALLPLSNSHLSALIWSAENTMSDTLLSLPNNEFNQMLTTQLDGRLGKLTIRSERESFPLVMRHADDYVSEKIALIGDAAHTLHPLAGQGVNLGLMDAASLAQALIDAHCQKKPLGDLSILRRYARARRADNADMIFVTHSLNAIFASSEPLLNHLRNFSVNIIDQYPWIKNQFMKVATGQTRHLPDFLS